MFTDVAQASGLNFVHFLGATGRFYFAEIAGAGCALLDYDNDGDLDVYLLQGSLLEPGKTLDDAIFPWRGPLPPRNRLFRNELIARGGVSGKLHFTDVTEESGAGDPGYAMGVATGDYDNDGDLDLYVTNFGPDVLLRNNADGTFSDVTSEAGLGDPRWTTSASFLDYDNDGLLDLFVAAYADFTISTNQECFRPGSSKRDYCGPRAYSGLPCRLYRNLGNGRFEDVSARTGIDAAYGHGLGVVAGDFDQNGWLDIYVANDGDENQLWMNDQGHFVNMGLISGSALNARGEAEAGMGIAAQDLDGDGDLDLFVTHLMNETNTLLENVGSGMFEDVTARHGVGMPSLPYTGFGLGAFDMDHDADLDLFIANGAVYSIEQLAGEAYPYHQANQILINTGNGRFEDRSKDGGAVMALSEVSRGVALGDIDNDGDIDILVSNNNGPVRLLRNELDDKRNWIGLRVMDEAFRRDAFGATVRLTLGDGRVLTRIVHTDGSYLSANDPRVHFAWPEDLEIASLEILSQDGRSQRVQNVVVKTISTVTIGGSRADSSR
ncbi:MAG: CRTAC1 family protein [Acidobacteriota bacterium]